MTKVLRGLNAAIALSMIGMVQAGIVGKQEARDAIEPMYEDDIPKYGPGAGKVPKDLEPTRRDLDRMSAAEERRAARRQRNLRNLKQ